MSEQSVQCEDPTIAAIGDCLLDKIRFPGNGIHPVQSPLMVRLVLNAALSDGQGGVCLVLPTSENVDTLLSALAALSMFPEDAAATLSDQVQQTFQPGQKVRVLPDGGVYRVGDPVELHGISGYYLHFLDVKKGSGNGRFVVYGNDLNRLEPTERSRPLGGERKDWPPPQRAGFDRLAGTSTLGNHARLRNRVLLVDSRSELARFLEETRLIPAESASAEMAPPLADDFPWGGINADGTAFIEHPRATPGEPLVAASRDFPALRKASEAAAPRTKVFLSRWLKGCLDNLDTVSRISERHRFVVIADAARRRDVTPFRKAGWTVWEPTPTELLGSDGTRYSGINCIDLNVAAASRESKSRISYKQASDEHLYACYEALGGLGDAIRSADADDAEQIDELTGDIVGGLWRLFLDACGWLKVPEADIVAGFDERLADIHLTTLINSRMLPETVSRPIETARASLESFRQTCGSDMVTPKGELTLETLLESVPPAIVFGNAQDRDQARQWLVSLDAEADLRAVGDPSARDEQFVAGISLMARAAFSRFVDPFPAKHLLLAGYDFEIDTYKQRLRARTSYRRRLALDNKAKSRLTGLPEANFPQVPEEAGPGELAPQLTGIERVAAVRRRPTYTPPSSAGRETDQTREGRLCRFVGCSWAIFTDGHSISVLAESSERPVERKAVSDLSVGDRVLLRDSGDKDVIRLLAEDVIGTREYVSLWERGQQWREALRTVATDPWELWLKLKNAGLHRDPVTIRYWLLGDDVIGPQNQDDIKVIAEAAGLRPDDERWQDCWDAIREVRGLHMQAGRQLTKILSQECSTLLLDEVEHEQAIELSLGLMWLVTVEAIGPSEHWQASLTNRLTWGQEGWREQMLRDVLRAEGA